MYYIINLYISPLLEILMVERGGDAGSWSAPYHNMIIQAVAHTSLWTYTYCSWLYLMIGVHDLLYKILFRIYQISRFFFFLDLLNSLHFLIKSLFVYVIILLHEVILTSRKWSVVMSEIQMFYFILIYNLHCYLSLWFWLLSMWETLKYFPQAHN